MTSLKRHRGASRPLADKLGLRPGAQVLVLNGPRSYYASLGRIADTLRFATRARSGVHMVHLFAGDRQQLARAWPRAQRSLAPDGALWVSWPKRSSARATDLDENQVRTFGLAQGMVDVRVCSVDPTWSALKFVYRLRDRPALVRHMSSAGRRATRGRARSGKTSLPDGRSRP